MVALLSSFGLAAIDSAALTTSFHCGSNLATHTVPITLARPAMQHIEADAGFDIDQGPSNSLLVGIARDVLVLPHDANLRFKRLLETYHITAIDRKTSGSSTSVSASSKSGLGTDTEGKGGASQQSGGDDRARAVVLPQWLLANTVWSDY